MTATASRIPSDALDGVQAVQPPRPRRQRSTGIALLFVLPAVILLAVFLLAPFCIAVYLSFTNERLASPLPRVWVGWHNYHAILTDPRFRQALINNVVFAVVVVPLQTALALALAVLVNRRVRGVALLRALFFAPVVMGIAVASTVWYLLFDPEQGMLNGVLKLLSWGHLHSGWLTSTSMALPSVIIMSIWSSVGLQMVILLAALQDVPTDLYEAAALDGATPWQQFRAVTFPGIRNALVFVLTMTTIFAFRLFDQVYIMTSGRPRGHTNTMLLELVQVGYERQQIGRACAIAVVFFVFVVGFAGLQRWIVREDAS